MDARISQMIVPAGGHVCVGIDLHKDTMMVCVYIRGSGEFAFRKIACKNKEQIAEFFRTLPRPHTVAIEAVGFYRWLWELLELITQKLVLCDATQVRALAGRRLKTDREDAFNVAELLAADRLPLAYAPPMEVQILRDWTRQRNRLSRAHARALHGVKSLMNANNRPGPKRLTSGLLSRYLLAFQDKLPERHVRMLWQHERQLAALEEEIGMCEREIVRYAGLTPTLYASGGKERHGHISKTDSSDLRWVLQQAAWTAIRCDERIKRRWLKISRGSGKKAAAVAIARQLLVALWQMVRRNEPYRTLAEPAHAKEAA